MGPAYDFAFRPLVGEPEADSGGGCDDDPREIALLGARADPKDPSAIWMRFRLCPGHTDQLRRYDQRLMESGTPSRFRSG
ncbi:MAG: hypothetical protein WCA77_09160 [Thermoplasmata archaeon]